MKRIDFPIRPYLLKYLQVHLKLTSLEGGEQKVIDFVLTPANKRFGLPLTHLLSKSVKSARHEGSNEDCTSVLGIDLRNYKGMHYALEQGKVSAYAVFEFNETVDELFRSELYWWVAQHRERRATIKDAIISFMALYEVREEEIAFETLRKDVQRNADLPKRKKNQPKTKNFPANLSQKIGGVSRKKGVVSRNIGVLSHKDSYDILRQSLNTLPLPLFEAAFFRHAHAA